MGSSPGRKGGLPGLPEATQRPPRPDCPQEPAGGPPRAQAHRELELCQGSLWHKAFLGPRCCCRAPSVRPKEPHPTGAAALSTPAVRNGILGQENKNGFLFFFFCINGKKIQEKLPPSPTPTKCDALPLLQFLSHCFRRWSRDRPADSPGSNPGGVCITPFYLYKKKK